MMIGNHHCRAAALCLAALIAGGMPAADAAQQAPTEIEIAYVTRETPPPIPLTFLEPVIPDKGIQGARLGVVDNDTTGRFTGQDYELRELIVPEQDDVAAAVRAALQDGVRLIVADLQAQDLLAIADLPEAADAVIFNTAAKDDALRNEECRVNLLHIVPSRAMLADALAQYLMWKRWNRWFLVVGRHPGDKRYAEAVRRAATRFGAEIVAEKEWTFEAGNRRVDTGHTTIQSQIPPFTQAPDHDVLIVADEADEFGEYLSYHTYLPRPVAGTQGLVPTAWSRVHEQWGGTQLQSRFEKHAGRWMTERDYTAWAAVRSIGEAATRSGSAEPGTIVEFLHGPDFNLAAFKGQALTFRDWDGQMRQPVLLAGPRMLVSVSPQEGYLHQFSELDTLGYDRPESTCRM